MAHGPKHYGLYTPQGSTVHEEVPVTRTPNLDLGTRPCRWPDLARVNPWTPGNQARSLSGKPSPIVSGSASQSWIPSLLPPSALGFGASLTPTVSDVGAQSP